MILYKDIPHIITLICTDTSGVAARTAIACGSNLPWSSSRDRPATGGEGAKLEQMAHNPTMERPAVRSTGAGDSGQRRTVCVGDDGGLKHFTVHFCTCGQQFLVQCYAPWSGVPVQGGRDGFLCITTYSTQLPVGWLLYIATWLTSHCTEVFRTYAIPCQIHCSNVRT